MKRLTTYLIAALLLLGLAGLPHAFSQNTDSAPAENGVAAIDPQAPLFEGLGDTHHPISTTSPLAQTYFDQGLVLAYGFNHAEAARSFREAARLDPDCAMCHWGLAYVLGPNINAAMADDAVPEAYIAIQRAQELSDRATPLERAYIAAMAQRYPASPVEDRSELDRAYAEAMGQVVQQYPDDLDAAVLYAEALMDTTPWNYWTEDDQPREATRKLLDSLESVLSHDPNHPGANHLYIHAVEAVHPEWAEATADRLATLVPGAGHLVHMPSHIYINVGRYHDAAVSNQAAISADDDYVTQCHAQGLYPLAYIPHNEHFLWSSAAMEGQGELSIQTARELAASVNRDLMPELGVLQHFYAIPYYGLARFGRWQEILAEPAPEVNLPYPMGVWHYARGMAFANTGQLEQAEQELARVKAIAADPELEAVTVFDINSVARLMEISKEVLSGEIARQSGDLETAIAALETAVELEDALIYNEPEDWYLPVRQILGAALLEADRPEAAEAVYRQDLVAHERNGWSLFGLTQSLEAQGRSDEAQMVRDRFDEAWQYADVELTASRL